MWFVGPGKPSPARTRKRAHDRYASDLLVCALGQVLDLSGSGIRIGGKGRCALARGQVIPLKLEAPQGALTLKARVVRVTRCGFRAFEVGLEFVGMKPAIARALKNLAEFGFVANPGVTGRHVPGDVNSGPQIGGNGPAKPVTAGQMKRERACQVLQVGRDASAEEIRVAYRKLVLRYHPDVNSEPNADQQFADIVEAYRMLRDAMD
ncbi:MAG: DnaJ domain-containing protein [Tepidisphaeraceae bacterium]